MKWNDFLVQLNTVNPVLARHLTEWEDASIAEYAAAIWQHTPGVAAGAEVRSAVAVMDDVARRYYGPGVSVAEQLTGQRVVLTVHHTAPVFHPIALQTLLLAVASDSAPRRIPVLATDWVPMDNMFFPRGILLPSERGLQGYNLFGKRSRKKLVSNMEPFERADAHQLIAKLHKSIVKGDLEKPLGKAACEFVESVYFDEFVLTKSSYKQQCTAINFLAWRRLFPGHQLIQLNLSDVIVPLLVDSIRDPHSLIYRILFDPQTRLAVLDTLNGVGGCWDFKKNTGSCFFWHQRDGKMLPLLDYRNNTLEGDGIRVELRPETVENLLLSERLLPGLFVVFVQLMFSNRLVCVGGMRQIAYNADIRDGLLRVFARDAPRFLSAVKNFPVDRFAAGINALRLAPGRAITLVELLSSPLMLDCGWRQDPLRDAVLEASDYLLSLSAA